MKPTETRHDNDDEYNGYKELARCVITQAMRDIKYLKTDYGFLFPKPSKEDTRAAKDFFAGINDSSLSLMLAVGDLSRGAVYKALKENRGFDVNDYRLHPETPQRSMGPHEHDNLVVKLAAEGKTPKQIQKATGIKSSSIYKIYTRNNIKTPLKKRLENFPQEERERVVSELRSKKLTYEQIAQKTGLSITAVYNICKKLGL